MTKAILTYCIENQFAAANIVNALAGKAHIDKVIFDADNGISLLEKLLNSSNSNCPVMMLVSDNFLKSENCMNGALELVQKLGASKRLIPVTTDGIYLNGGSNEYVHISTSFDRVSNVIQYMNHWQDKYLEMRKSKPTGVDEILYSEKVRIVRNISSEVGEMLRYMRAMEYYSTDQFEDSNFIILYRVLGIDAAAHIYERKPEMAVSQPVFSSIKDKKEVDNEPLPYINGTHTDTPFPLPTAKDPDLAQLLNGNAFKEVKETVAPLADMEQVTNFHKEFEVPTHTNTVTEMAEPTTETPDTLEALIEDIKKDTQYLTDNEDQEAVADSNVSKIIDDIVNEDDAIVDKTVHAVHKEGLANMDSLFIQNEDEDALKQLDNSIFGEALYKDEKQTTVQNTKNPNDTTASLIPTNDIIMEKNIEPNLRFDTPFQNDEIENEQKATNSDESGEEDALLSLRDALDNDPTDRVLQYEYATKLVEAQQYQEAIEQLELLVELDRTNIDAYILMAFAAEQSGDYLLSLNCLEKVTLLKPDYPGIFYKLGTLVNERFKGPKRKALRYFSEAINHNPQDANAHFQLAKLEIESGADMELVVAHLQDTLTHNPNHAEAAMELAKVSFELGDKDTAAALYARAWANQPAYKTEQNDDIFRIVPVIVVQSEPVPEPTTNALNDNGMVVMITGATSGIGKATADIFAQHGYRLILTGRRNDRLDEIQEQLTKTHRNRNITLNFDVRDHAAIKNALIDIEEDFKNIDILINNAGLASGLAPIHEGDLNDWDTMIDTNIKGLLYMTRAIAPNMVERQKGHIINLSSIAGKEIYPNGNVYNASKHAVDALTRAMRLDLHKHNIRVSQVTPGAVEETEFALIRFHGDSEKAKIYEDFKPLKASDVAETIFFIASRAEYINIQDIVMMGTQQASANHFDRSGRKDIRE
jgi:NADP-dependent 3-hydroxy acid dehydrogenase YdfG/Flp pilus assembly protein TadD